MTWHQDTRTCWDLKTLRKVSGFDAVSASRPIFNATHTPLPIVRRTEVRPFDGGVESSEIDLLSEFFYSDNPDGALIIPVIGDRGVGKSHIIRFLFENRPNDQRAHVVYIPKSGTDLRSTIGLIIEGLDERFDEIRASLATAQSQNPSPDEAVDRLLAELFLKISSRSRQPSSDDKFNTALLSHSAALLNDAYFRQQFAELGGPRRIVAGPLGEDIDVADDKRTVFSLEDLPFGQITKDQMAETARDAYTQFSMSISAQKKFLQFINEVLTAALQEVFWSNGPKLTTLLRDVRHLLLEDDREIFLLIEDLVELSGLQDELLQAFITPAVASPGEPKTLAPLKVAFAMTNEPFRKIRDTVVSRVESVYAIDLSRKMDNSKNSSFGSEDQVAFLSRYLNAVRYSVEEISEFDENHLGEQLPSKCDTCSVADKCLQDFGSHNGIGMYPFTTSALVNLLEARSKDSFNPRGAIRGVLAEIMREAHHEISSDRFPSDEVIEAFKSEENAVPLEVMNEIKVKFGDDTSRRINLQRFWTSDRSVRDPWTEWMRICFGLGDDANRVPRPRRNPPSTSSDSEPPKRSGDSFAYLDVWATGGDAIIPETPARLLRTVLYQLVSGQLEDRYGISISKPIFNVQNGKFLQRDSFMIAQSGGGGSAGENSRFWTTQIDTSISTALIFKNMLQASNTGNLLSPAKLSEIYKFLEPMIQGAKQEYELRYGDLSAYLDRLGFFANVFGCSNEYLNDFLSEELDFQRMSNGRGTKWINAINQWTELRNKSLEEFLAISGVSKGGGGTLSTRTKALLSKHISNSDALAIEVLPIANLEMTLDNKKVYDIALMIDGQDPKKLFAELRDLFSDVGLNLSGILIPQPQLLGLSRKLDDLDRNWNSELLAPPQTTELTSEETIKKVANTDTNLMNWFLKELTEILNAVDEIVSRADQLSQGSSTSNATLIEIQSSLLDVQKTLEQLA
jgi:hypothetical protein